MNLGLSIAKFSARCGLSCLKFDLPKPKFITLKIFKVYFFRVSNGRGGCRPTHKICLPVLVVAKNF